MMMTQLTAKMKNLTKKTERFLAIMTNNFTCNHDGIVPVLTIGSTTVFAGAGKDMATRRWDMLFALATGYVGSGDICKAINGADALLPEALVNVPKSPILEIDWADGKAPPLSREWWDTLIEWLEDESKGERSVGVYCIGGHGRTGTFLSILTALCFNDEKVRKEPVKWVRQNYCRKAVETNSQLNYIEGICGIKLKDVASDVFVGHAAGAHGSYGHWQGGAQQHLPTPVSSGVVDVVDDDDDWTPPHGWLPGWWKA